MILQDKIKVALEQGKVEGAKRLASELLKQEHRSEWDRDKREEYDGLFPTYYPTEQEFVFTSFDDDMNKWREAKEADGFIVTVFDTEKQYAEYRKAIDYSEDENYVTYDEWINETRVVREEAEATYDEDGIELTPHIPEITEQVRPYTQLDITDEMVEVQLNEFRDVKQEALDYLASTDWYVIRYADNGDAIPEEVMKKRQEAREIV